MATLGLHSIPSTTDPGLEGREQKRRKREGKEFSEGKEQDTYYRRGSEAESVGPWEGGKTAGGVRTRKDPEVGEADYYMVHLPEDRQGASREWKKRIGKTEDDSCGICGVQETGWHLAFECPVNEEIRKAYINGAQTWEDLDDKVKSRKGEWNMEAFFGKATSSKGWG